MSLQIRFLCEIGPSAPEEAAIRVEAVETVMPATLDEDDWTDLTLLGGATLDRMGEDTLTKARDQFAQFGEMQQKVASTE